MICFKHKKARIKCHKCGDLYMACRGCKECLQCGAVDLSEMAFLAAGAKSMGAAFSKLGLTIQESTDALTAAFGVPAAKLTKAVRHTATEVQAITDQMNRRVEGTVDFVDKVFHGQVMSIDAQSRTAFCVDMDPNEHCHFGCFGQTPGGYRTISMDCANHMPKYTLKPLCDQPVSKFLVPEGSIPENPPSFSQEYLLEPPAVERPQEGSAHPTDPV